ncbi:hypothetical protein [Psychrobacter lutiphocae]|uniref:hypothetical protein n=1 Tax=Psychrobacter lutiphocae TaxID=540500 RepID=UPI000366AAD6|nr:hypothetical protein [Psychrobacter lutiphocae]
MTKQPKQRKGATTLQLDTRELRQELRYADQIITTICDQLSASEIAIINYKLRKDGISAIDDPMRKLKRQSALYRIAPKRDSLKVLLAVFLGFFITAWYCAYTENDLLRTELARAQSQPVQLLKSHFSKGGFRGIPQATQGE